MLTEPGCRPRKEALWASRGVSRTGSRQRRLLSSSSVPPHPTNLFPLAHVGASRLQAPMDVSSTSTEEELLPGRPHHRSAQEHSPGGFVGPESEHALVPRRGAIPPARDEPQPSEPHRERGAGALEFLPAVGEHRREQPADEGVRWPPASSPTPTKGRQSTFEAEPSEVVGASSVIENHAKSWADVAR
jgi:hypothetical protein